MNPTQEWAQRWNVPQAALNDLAATLGTLTEPQQTKPTTPEAAVQNMIRLEASRKGLRVWRNNVGACQDESGRFIRYGLANDSQKMNAAIKSSDLIGIRPVKIAPGHVGHTIGQFVAREVKAGDWKYRGTKREAAQLAFLTLVNSMGGDASFASCQGTL